MTLLFKPLIFLGKYLTGLFLALALIAGVIWALNRPRPQWETDAALARTAPLAELPQAQTVTAVPISQPELQRLIAEVYGVQTSRFLEQNLLWVTFSPGETEQQKKCQGIANMYALRNGMSYFRVECWAGNARLGQGTVMHGVLADP